MSKNEIKTAISALEDAECAVETNEGTYGSGEAMRKIGCGDPQFANYTIYERVGSGARRVQGCTPEKAPGYGREMRQEITEKRNELAELKKQLCFKK